MRKISIATYADLHRDGYRLSAWCSSCERSAFVDLDAVIANGLGGRSFIDKKYRCSKCGKLGPAVLLGPTPDGLGAQRDREPPPD